MFILVSVFCFNMPYWVSVCRMKMREMKVAQRRIPLEVAKDVRLGKF